VDRVFDLLGLPPEAVKPYPSNNNNDNIDTKQQLLVSSQNRFAVNDIHNILMGESGSCPQLTASLTATCAAATSTANNCPHSVPASNNVDEEKFNHINAKLILP